ncbi:MAG: hypothetical protein MUC52_03580 [Candidatus Omnitrophica bacterium]|nr:hypothetical protein [Candidatus Omnitrophota bacterium]
MIPHKKLLALLAAVLVCCASHASGADLPDLDKKKITAKDIDAPVVVNGDTVEYLTEQKQVIASGNVFIIFKGTKLTCDNLKKPFVKCSGGHYELSCSP